VRRAVAVTIVLLATLVALAPKRPTPPVQAALNRAGLAAGVREETLAAWRAYESSAWGHDELRPVTRTPKDWYGESLLMTPVDSLDTLLLMGLNDQADRAKALILEKLSFDKDIFVKNFEITIRLLGGLLSGYQMTKEKRLLDLLSGDSAKDEQSAASYGGDRVLAAIMRDHSELDADEVRKKLDDLF